VKRINSRDLIRRVTIQEDKGSDRDALNAHVEDWQTVATVWAAVEPLLGNILFSAQQAVPGCTHKVRMRHRSDITVKRHRLVYEPPDAAAPRVLTILSSLDVQSLHRERCILCSEAVA
jgi:SPP1 family predicted phage head-tail adaptor